MTLPSSLEPEHLGTRGSGAMPKDTAARDAAFAVSLVVATILELVLTATIVSGFILVVYALEQGLTGTTPIGAIEAVAIVALAGVLSAFGQVLIEDWYERKTAE